ncbi:MAG: DUF6677 family protein [Planctomycetaceae bacterium]
MTDPRIDLKSPWIAGVLAFLIPGAGHLYQGRVFKGALYMVCILGTFSYGLALGEGQVVYRPQRSSTSNYYGYYAQAWVGLPSLPALVQSWRYTPVDERFAPVDPEKRAALEEAVEAPFNGRISYTDAAGRRFAGETTGHVSVEPVREGAREVRGRYNGTLADGTPVDVALGGAILVGPKVFASEDVAFRRLDADGGELRTREPTEFSGSRRYLRTAVIDPGADRELGLLEGTVPRGFSNWFAVPPTEAALNDFNFRLGKILELAFVCTWIAGLLNLLAIWDAVEGPAYGYGDASIDGDEARGAPATTSQPLATTKALAADKPPPS